MLHSPKLFIRCMRLTDSIILQKIFSKNYKHTRLTQLYGIMQLHSGKGFFNPSITLTKDLVPIDLTVYI